MLMGMGLGLGGGSEGAWRGIVKLAGKRNERRRVVMSQKTGDSSLCS
jgi:hypothetical protein